MDTDLRVPHALFLPVPASVWQPATQRSQAHSTNLQKIPFLKKQGKLYKQQGSFQLSCICASPSREGISLCSQHYEIQRVICPGRNSFVTLHNKRNCSMRSLWLRRVKFVCALKKKKKIEITDISSAFWPFTSTSAPFPPPSHSCREDKMGWWVSSPRPFPGYLIETFWHF